MHYLISMLSFAYLVLMTLCLPINMDRNRITRKGEEISFLNGMDAINKVQQLMHTDLRTGRQISEIHEPGLTNLSQVTTKSPKEVIKSDEKAEKYTDLVNSGKGREITEDSLNVGYSRNRSKRLYEQENRPFDLRAPDISEKKPDKPRNFLYIKEREVQIFMPKAPALNKLNIDDNQPYAHGNEPNAYSRIPEARINGLNAHGNEPSYPGYDPYTYRNEQENRGDLSRPQMQGYVSANQVPGEYPSWYQVKMQTPKNFRQNPKPAISFYKDELEQQRFSKEGFKVGQSQARNAPGKTLQFPARMVARDNNNDIGRWNNTSLGRNNSFTSGGYASYVTPGIEISTQEPQTSAMLQNNSNSAMNVNLRGDTINFVFPQNPLDYQLASGKRNDRDFLGLLGNMVPGSKEKSNQNSQFMLKRQSRESKNRSSTNQAGKEITENGNHAVIRQRKESDNHYLLNYSKRNGKKLSFKAHKKRAE